MSTKQNKAYKLGVNVMHYAFTQYNHRHYEQWARCLSAILWGKVVMRQKTLVVLAALGAGAIFGGVRECNGGERHEPFRVMCWNIQDGMWDGQGDDYARFVAYVKAKAPDVCIWTEAESLLKTGKCEDMPAEERFLPKGWPTLAARYGHRHVYLAEHTPYVDIVKRMHPDAFRPSVFNDRPGYGHRGGRRIDFVYLTPELARFAVAADVVRDDYACSVRDAARLGANLRHPSDHLPVIVDFSFSERNKDKQE